MKLQEIKSQDVIKKGILEEKNKKTKECNTVLQQSLEVSKTYETLKNKLNEINEEEHELKLELKFLQKQVKLVENRGKLLDQELDKTRNKCETVKIKRDSKSILPKLDHNDKTGS